ncbi:MAG: hypothetical protein JJ969_10620 [Rhizobiaceae bacterium]|nr:hypothetical protein [Rhizobiaceae bacterium]
MPVSNAEKEKIKLQANFINGLALGSVLIGAFTPITRAAYDLTIAAEAFVFMALLGIVCFALGIVLHSNAARHLEALNK